MKTEQELIELAGNALFEAHVTKGMDIETLFDLTREHIQTCVNGYIEATAEMNFKKEDI